jgi:CspA family cold shock protein
MESCQTSSTTETHMTGRVKWFNNKAGYGFISINDGVDLGTDIFVHNSAIKVDKQQYKYLVQGEYVEFDLVKTTSQKHEFQASNVSGIKNGKLMCETRHELKSFRNYDETSKDSRTMDSRTMDSLPSMPTQKIFRDSNRPPSDVRTTDRYASNQPRNSNKIEINRKGWTIVENKKDSTKRTSNLDA